MWNIISLMDTIQFLSDEGIIVDFPRDLLQYTALLDMLHRRHTPDTGPIRTSVALLDLQLTEAICATGILPCDRQKIINPKGFQSYQDLVDYMGISGIDLIDKKCKLINDILSYLRVPEFQLVKNKDKNKNRGKKKQVTCAHVTTKDDILQEVAKENENGEIILNRWTRTPETMDYPYSSDDDYMSDFDDDW